MKSNTTTVLVAAGALLVGGIATAAFMSGRGTSASPSPVQPAQPVLDTTPLADDAAAGNALAPREATLEYADVLKVAPISRSEPAYATVIGTEPVRQTSTTTVPREVCEDVVVEERLPERDGNVGGTVAGAVIGGLLGNQVGKGGGRAAATMAGVVGGAVAGNAIEERNSRPEHYRITIRLDRGGQRAYDVDSYGDLRTGDRVRLRGGEIARL